MKVNLDIPDPLYKRLRTQASVRGLRVKDFMVVFLEEGLDQLGDDADSVTEAVDSALED